MAVSEEQNQQETNHSVDESELEQYGVWVKAGPEDVIEAEAEDDAFTLDDLSEDALTDAENDLLSSDELAADVDVAEITDELEEVTLDTLEDDSGEITLSDDMDQSELAVAAGERFEAVPEDELVELTLDEFDDEVDVADAGSAEEIEVVDFELEDEPAQAASGEELGSDLLTLEEDDLTIDLGQESEELGIDVSDDLQIEPDALPAEPVDEGADLGELEEELILDDLPEDDLLTEEAESAPVLESAGSGDGIVDDDLNIEEDLPDDLNDLTLNLDDLDVDAFEEPMIGASEEPDEVLDEPLDLAEFGEEATAAADEVEDLDLSALPGEDESFAEISPDELTQADEGELPELSGDDELTELTLDETSLDEDLAALGEPAPVDDSDSIDLLDLGDDSDGAPEGDFLEEMDSGEELLDLADLTEQVPADDIAASAPTPAATDDRSISVLENIEKELSSIRSEIGDLKRELGELRTTPGAAAAVTPAAPEDEGEDGTVGFFEGSEDEDETIALTGAELDNIMNTADFVEETGQPTEIDDLIAPADAPTLDELLPEADDEPLSVTEIALEELPDDSEPIEIDLDANDTVALVGSEDEVEALASMDIDAELADIEELEDTTESATDASPDDLDVLDMGEDVLDLSDESLPSDDEPVFDAEPVADDLLDESVEDEPLIDLAEDIELIDPTATDEAVLMAEPSLPIEPAIPETLTEAEAALPDNLKSELRSVLSYMDQLLESLPEEKIQEFAQSDHFTVYRRLFEELGLEQ